MGQWNSTHTSKRFISQENEIKYIPLCCLRGMLRNFVVLVFFLNNNSRQVKTEISHQTLLYITRLMYVCLCAPVCVDANRERRYRIGSIVSTYVRLSKRFIYYLYLYQLVPKKRMGEQSVRVATYSKVTINRAEMYLKTLQKNKIWYQGTT